MSEIFISKNKHKEEGYKEVENLRDEINQHQPIIKQIKNIKLSKYSKYFGSNSHNIELALLKIKDNKKSLVISKGNNEYKGMTEKSFKMSSLKPKHRLLSEANHKQQKYESLEKVKIQNFIHDNNLDVITERESFVNESNKIRKYKLFAHEINLNFEELDREIKENPQFCVEYFTEIYKNFIKEENALKRIKDYMKFQNEINQKMRAILVDWMIDVHLKFKLTTETLFLSVYLLDVYLSNKIIQRDQLQLVGIASLLIASKYEEIYSPDIRDFEYITDKGYTKKEILHMEHQILKIMQFDITIPSSFRFYEIISINLSFNSKEFYLGRYLLELFLTYYRSTKYSNSLIACSVCFIILNLFTIKDPYKLKAFGLLKEFIDFNLENEEKVLRECCKDICFIFDHIDDAQLSNIKRKFSSNEFCKVSKISYKSLLYYN